MKHTSSILQSYLRCQTSRFFLGLIVTASLGEATLKAQQSLTWDPAGNGSGSGGAGTWNLNSTADWYNGSSDVTWSDNSASGTNSATFGGTGGTVTLSSSLSASNLLFNVNGYTISGSGTLTLGSGGINASSLSSGTTTIGAALSLPVTQEPWQVGSGGTLVINGALTRSTGASVDFLPNDVTPTGITTTSPGIVNDAGGIIDGWATAGNLGGSGSTGDFLSVSNDYVIMCSNYLAVSSSASTSPNTNTMWNANLISGALNGNNEITTITNSTVINSLVQQGDFSVADGATLTINSGGIIQRGESRWLLDNGGGNLGTAVIESGLASGELFIHMPNSSTSYSGNANNWNIWPRIQDNGATRCIVVKDGPGLVSLDNVSSYSGGTIINNGILAATKNVVGDSNTNGQTQALGTGRVTINGPGILEIGFGTSDATQNYPVTNSLVISGGSVLADDGHNHLTGPINVLAGGATFGSTYDGGADPNAGNKSLQIDGLVSGSGPITLEQSVQAGDSDIYGNGSGNSYNSSVVEFANNANTYSGTITIIPFQTGSDAGSYVTVNGSTALQFATLNLTNNTGGQRYAGVGGVYTAMIFNSGLGSATLGAVEGSGNIILQGFNENTYTNTLDPIALSVGNNNSSTTYSGDIVGSGSLNKVGTGTLTISSTTSYTGNTTVNGGTLALTGTFVDSSNIVVDQGATLNLSGLASATLASGQNLYSSGTVNGSLSASSLSEIFSDSGTPYGTNTFNNNLTLNSSALVHLSVSTSTGGPNDLIKVIGTLTANDNVIHISAPSTSVSLQTADYTLITAGSISGNFTPAVSWDVAPVNAGNFSIVTSGNTVKLHYAAATSPTGGGAAAPNPAVRNQNVLVTVTTTNGSGGTVNSVTVNASSIGGSSSLALVNAGGNVWTNSVLVSSNTLAGSATLVATITDTASLNGIANIPLNIIVTNRVWNGAGANANWGNGLNWTDLMAPGLVGDGIEFAGTSDLSPNMDSSYTITSLAFAANAGAFNIGSGNGSVLTLSGTITNSSPNAQTLGMVIAGTSGLTLNGSGAINLTANETYSGNTVLNAGTLNVSGTINSTASFFIGETTGNSVLNLSPSSSISPFYFLIGNTANSAGAVYQNANVSAAQTSAYDNVAVGNVGGAYGYYDVMSGTLTAAGVAVGGEDNTSGGANFGSPGGNGIMDIQNGATVNDEGWFVMCRNNTAQTGILNVYAGGSMSYAGGGLVCNWGAGQSTIINVWGTIAPPPLTAVGVGLGSGTSGILNLESGGLVQGTVFGGNFGGGGGVFNFNGGTMQALPSLATAVSDLVNATAMYSYSGGAIMDYNGSTVTNGQPLLAPAGKGIYSASITSGGAGYIAPPIVTIVPGSGDTTGTGATAIAQINPVTGIVTTVIITCPGQNYTATPTFVLSGGGATTQATITSAAPATNTCGGLTVVNFAGGGYGLVLTGVNTYTGSTVVSNNGVAATLALSGSGSIANSTNITTQSGCVFDVSALNSFTVASGQYLSGLGNINGNVTANAGSYVSAGQGGTLGVNTFNNNLTLASGADVSLTLSTTYNGNNDQIVVSGTLTANNNVIHLSAPSTSSSLDTTADYVLITAGSISGSFASAPVWDVAPVNAGHYSIVTSGNQVTLHYSATVSSPTVTATATPSTLLRNQPTLVTANVTPGSASISTVKADFTSLGGTVVSLVESNSSTLWTNTVIVPPAAAAGNDSVTVTATDSANNSGSSSVQLTIVIGNDVWNGTGANANFSTALNWTNKLAPGYVGDSIEFATNLTDLSPNVDQNYTVTALTFDTNAGAFNISSSDSSVLTMSGNGAIMNNSTNAQTLNVVVADSGGGITKSGTGAVTLAANNTYTGPTLVNTGTLNIPGQVVAASNSVTVVGNAPGNSVLNVSGTLWAYSIQVGNASNAVGAVYQLGSTVWANTNSGYDNLDLGNVPGSYGYYDANGGTLNVNGLCIGGEDNSGRSSTFGLAGNGIMDINNNAAVNDAGWLIIARNNNNTNGNEIGVLNMFSGSLTYAGGGIVGPWDTGESAIINVMGGMVSNTAAVGVYLGWTNFEGILNLNGGVLQASVVEGYNGPSYATVSYGQLNFNGGTLKASAGNSSFISTTAADIYSHGAVIDNNGFGITAATPLLAPAGKGVNGIASFAGGAGYVAPPIITITNGAGDTTGYGATAIAQINPASGTVTNIIITCPGVNYTATPVFIVTGGGATVAATVTGTVPTANISGGLTSIGSGTLTLTGANTYSGSTVVSNGTLSLASGASIAASPTINIVSGAIFDVSQVSSFALGAAQTLTGNGTVNGSMNSSGTIAPGSASAIGTLTFNNNLTLQSVSTVSMKLNETLVPNATNDQIVCSGTMTYGGTLAVSDPDGVLHVGDSFRLFLLTGTASANFATISGSPGAGMAYSFNPNTGVLSVVASSGGISNVKFTGSPVISGTTLSISATNTGSGTLYLLTSTNLLTPISQWTPVWTNVLGGSSAFTTNVQNAVNPGAKQQFYILSTQNQ